MHNAEVTRETCLSKTTCVCTCHICMLNYRRRAAQNGSSGSLERLNEEMWGCPPLVTRLPTFSWSQAASVWFWNCSNEHWGNPALPFPTPTLIPLCKFTEEPPLPSTQEHCPARITRVRDRADARSESRMLFCLGFAQVLEGLPRPELHGRL